jgi:hypothetical protein
MAVLRTVLSDLLLVFYQWDRLGADRSLLSTGF